MKLLSSFLKEVKLASQSFYFILEIVFSFILLFILAFVVPENMEEKKEDRYIFLDAPVEAETYFYDSLEDLDGQPEAVEVKVGKTVFPAALYENEDTYYYILESKADMLNLAESKSSFGAVVKIDSETYEATYEYYLQGYETERLKNLLKVVHIRDVDTLDAVFDEQEVRKLSTDYDVLSDRENAMPALLTFNGALMGLFILAAYMMMDKKEGVIKAYAVTPSPVWQYLASKILVVVLTAVITTLIIVIPILGLKINYGWLIIFLIGGGVYACSLGQVLSSFYEDMEQAFGLLFTLMLVHGIPVIAYYIPSWDPLWLKFIPSYYIVYGFKELIIQNGDIPFVLWSSLGLFSLGFIMFLLAVRRVRRTLSV